MRSIIFSLLFCAFSNVCMESDPTLEKIDWGKNIGKFEDSEKIYFAVKTQKGYIDRYYYFKKTDKQPECYASDMISPEKIVTKPMHETQCKYLFEKYQKEFNQANS